MLVHIINAWICSVSCVPLAVRLAVCPSYVSNTLMFKIMGYCPTKFSILTVCTHARTHTHTHAHTHTHTHTPLACLDVHQLTSCFSCQSIHISQWSIYQVHMTAQGQDPPPEPPPPQHHSFRVNNSDLMDDIDTTGHLEVDATPPVAAKNLRKGRKRTSALDRSSSSTSVRRLLGHCRHWCVNQHSHF